MESFLTARLTNSGRSHTLEIINGGTESVVLNGVETPDAEGFLVEPVVPEDGVQLFPGETHRIIAAPTLGHPLHVKVVLSWIDDSGQRTRDVYVS